MLTRIPVARVLAVFGLAVLLSRPVRAETIRCPDIKDVWISAMGQEADCSMGRTDRMKLKVLQEFGLIGFDVIPLKGRQIRSAELFICPAGSEQKTLIPGRGTNLRWITISTVSSRWVEGEQDQSYRPDPKGHGATFNEASYRTKPWAWKGSDLSFVINGHLNSFVCVGELVEAGGGYWKVPVDPKVVQALVAGLGDGLAIMDGSSSHLFNQYVYSREAGDAKAPYLVVEVEGDAKPAAGKPQIIAVEPDPKHATPDAGALQIRIKTVAGALGYLVKVDGELMAPWQVELPHAQYDDQIHAQAGDIADRTPARKRMLEDRPADDVITLEDMPAGKKVSLAVAAVDSAGNVSDWTDKTGTVSGKVSVPPLPVMPWRPKAGDPKKAGDLSVWAFPEGVQVDPVSTLPSFEPDKEQFKRANAVWSGQDGKIRLAAARGEIAAFQVAIENPGQPAVVDVKVEIERGLSSTRPAELDQGVHCYRIWYVKAAPAGKAPASQPASQLAFQPHWCAEYAIPFPLDALGRMRSPEAMSGHEAQVKIPAGDNGVPGQRLQAVWVDVAVPQDTPPGTYRGRVSVQAHSTDPSATARGSVQLALELVVYPVTIPKDLNFQPEMYCYVTPGGQAGSHAFYEYHRLAHYNRTTINEVIHTQTGTIWQDMAPKLAGEGADTHVADWRDYDKRVGPLLDGSAFKGLPRDGVPVRAFYVPFNENWPMKLQGHYELGAPPQNEWSSKPRMSFDRPPPEDLSWKEVHDLKAKPIDQAFDEAYKKGFERVVGDFVKHFDQRGWSYPYVAMYQNNKYEHRGEWWTLDEPNEWLDWRALAFFADLYHKGMDFPHRAKFVYHVDISRPNWQGTFMDGFMDAMYSGGVGLKWPRLMQHIRERTGIQLTIYGSCNEIGRSNLESAAWCLRAYGSWADGVLPWDCLGKAEDLVTPNQQGLFVPGDRFGVTVVGSLRLAALRQGAQICELLEQVLDDHKDWTRWNATLLAGQKVPLASEFKQRFTDEAAAATFGRLTGAGFVELKEGLLQMLSHTGQ